MKTNETQPLPTEGEGDIMLALEKRVRERREKGVATYGRSLQAFNGRRALADAVEEAVDLAAYLEQELHERAKLEAQLAGLVRLASFLRCVIKSGEDWSETCEAEYRAVLPPTVTPLDAVLPTPEVKP
jgi:hypothetical protein